MSGFDVSSGIPRMGSNGSGQQRKSSVSYTAESAKKGPTNSMVSPMLTDMYQLSMTYAYWKQGRHNDHAVFDLFFRKNPFKGEFTVFAGLNEVLGLLSTFTFTAEDITFLKEKLMPSCEDEFFTYLASLDCSEMTIYAQKEGSIVFAKEPLLRIEGPLAVGQLLETVCLNLINYPSLVATNAARMRLAAGADYQLLEFGLRRAQGPDGGFSASKYAYLGGFNGTSNVLAAKLTDIECKGTHAHAFVMCYSSLTEIKNRMLPLPSDGSAAIDFVDLCLAKRKLLGFESANDGELAAFIAYAQSFPKGFLALIDTFDTLQSGCRNFLAVGLALNDLGYKPIGIRLDSGDLAYLSKEVRRMFRAADALIGVDLFSACTIVASNDINEQILLELERQGHEINAFGIGTHLVTCQAQPALGCVYKLVEINELPRIKLSQEVAKMTIPCKKCIYRLFSTTGTPILDIIQRDTEPVPQPGQRILCRHPFEEKTRAYVVPAKVESLLVKVWDKEMIGEVKSLDETRVYLMEQVEKMRPDHLRPVNPTPYKVSVSAELYDFMHNLWMEEAPIAELG